MQFLRYIVFSLVAALSAVATVSALRAQTTGGEQEAPLAATSPGADAGALQKKAAQAEARIRANEDDRGALMRAIKTNEIILAKQVLLRNGFTAEDLADAKITLRSGGGRGSENEIEILATCCEPKEITVQRTSQNFTK